MILKIYIKVSLLLLSTRILCVSLEHTYVVHIDRIAASVIALVHYISVAKILIITNDARILIITNGTRHIMG